MHNEDIDQFLETIHELEHTIFQLIQKSNLTDVEKSLIVNHIMIVPGNKLQPKK
ncbi:MAG: hypothetical protein JWM44_3273 [Bacilli bacterium]|nr:hypothetical protein [Bacilli bacterium]